MAKNRVIEEKMTSTNALQSKIIIFLMFSMVILMCCFSFVDAERIAYFKFNEGTGNVSLDNTNPAVNFTGNFTWLTGISGTSSSYNSTTVALSNYSISNGTYLSSGIANTNFTIEFWFKPYNITDKYAIIESMCDPNGLNMQGYEIFMDIDGDAGKMFFNAGNGVTYDKTWTTSALALNTWQHIAIVVNDTGKAIWINGIYNISEAWTTYITPSTKSTYIAAHNNQNADCSDYTPPPSLSYDYFGTFAIDELMFWNESRTAAQITTDMNEYLGPSPWTSNLDDGISGYWKFDNATTKGNIAVDSVGKFPVNGTMSGSGITTGQNCKLGECYLYDGSNGYVNISNHASIRNSSLFSVSIWLKAANTVNRAIVGRWTSSSSTRDWALEYGNGASAPGTQIEASSNKVSVPTGQYLITDPIAADTAWTHLVFTKNATGTTLYRNGTYIGSYAYTENIADSTTDTIIGLSFGAWGRFSGLVDDMIIYNRTLNSSEVSQLWNSGDGLEYPDIIKVTLGPPNNLANVYQQTLGLYANFTLAGYTFLNTTLTIWNYLDKSIYQTNYTALAGTSSAVINLSTANIPYGAYYWNYWTCAQSGDIQLCNFAMVNNTLTIGAFTENSQTFNPTTSPSSLESFQINLTYDSAVYTGLSAIIRYNGTNHIGTSSDAANNKVFTSTFTVPSTTVSMNASFYWIVTLTNITGGSYVVNSSFNNQTIAPIFIDNCTIYNYTLMNLNMLDQDTLKALNGTIEILAKVYALGTSNLISVFNASLAYTTDTPTRVCMSNITGSYTLAYKLKYYANTTYYSQYKEIQNLKINNTIIPQNITLYNLIKSSGYPFKISLTGVNDVSGILIDTQRQYVYLDTYTSVESSSTDSSGSMITYLVESTVNYNFIVSRNGVVLGTFNNYQVKCDSVVTGQCSFILNLAQVTAGLPDFINYGGVSRTTLYNHNTRDLYLTFNSEDGQIHTVSQEVFSSNGYMNTSISKNSLTGTSGTLTTNIPSSYGDDIIIQDIYIDGVYVGSVLISTRNPTEAFAGVSVILMMLLYSSLVLLMIAHPIMIVVGAIMGILLSILLLVSGGSGEASWAVFVYFALAGGIIIWQISKRL